MKLHSFDEKIHSLVFVIINVVFVIYVFSSKNYYYLLRPYLFSLVLMYIQNRNGMRIVFTIFGSFVFSFFCAYFVVFFPNEKYANGEMLNWYFKLVPKELVLNQFRVFLQVGMISNISFLSMRSIKFEKLMLYFMQNKWISATIGYPILLALNSMSLIKSEFGKIKINAKMRGLRFFQRINMLFPLLVFAVRHADRGALSLITRGLNEDKLYYFDVDLTKIDQIIIIIFIMLVFVCTALQFFL